MKGTPAGHGLLVAFVALMTVACGGRNEWLNVPLPERGAVELPAPLAGDAPLVRMTTSVGDVVVALYPGYAPVTVDNFLRYVDDGFYDGTIIHRVEPESPGPPVIQGGGFTPGLEPKPTRGPIRGESDNGLHNVRGAIAMARASDPDSATSQFFIDYLDAPGLDPRPGRDGYTVFGVVVEGMEVVDRITMVPVQPAPGTRLTRVPMIDVLLERVRRER
jgi:cyclophilin family peptidyl-prolyl cis-trans isomerase